MFVRGDHAKALDSRRDGTQMCIRDRVSSAGEVLRWGSKWELMLIPAFGFLLSGATIATGIKNAKGYRDDKALAVITFQRAVRNATVQGIVFIVATGIILYGVYTGSGIGI